MTDEQKPLSEFEQYTVSQLVEAGKALEHHNFILQAITSELEELKRRVPDSDDQPPVEGEQRGTTTVFKLPDGFGMLRVTINPDTGEALIDYGQQNTRQRVRMTFARKS